MGAKSLCGHKIDGEGLRGRCRNAAGWGTSHPGTGFCAHHGGEPSRELTRAGAAFAPSGTTLPIPAPTVPIQVEPHNAALWAIWITAGEISYLNSLIEAAGDDTSEIRTILKERRPLVRELRQSANDAMRSGLSEKQLHLAERMAAIVGEAIMEVTARLNLTRRQREAFPIILDEVLRNLELGNGNVEGSINKAFVTADVVGRAA